MWCIKNGCREVDEVRKRDFEDKESATDLEDQGKETNEQRHVRFVNLLPCLSLITVQ